jgi:NADH dehydrogenase FAD-containing subunit
MSTVLVVGTGIAGVTAALSLSNSHNVVLCGDREHIYQPGVIDYCTDRVETASFDVEKFTDGSDIRFLDGRPEDSGDGYTRVDGQDIEYDILVSAPRLVSREPEFSLEYALDMYDPGEAADASETDGSAVVIGAGRRGVETAFMLAEKGCEVRLIERSTRPLPGYRREVSEALLARLDSAGVGFSGGKEVKHVTNYGLELESGEEVEAGTTIWCGGLEYREDGLDHDKLARADSDRKIFREAEQAGLKAAAEVQGEEFESRKYGREILRTGSRGTFIGKRTMFDSSILRYIPAVSTRLYRRRQAKRQGDTALESVKSALSPLNVMGE